MAPKPGLVVVDVFGSQHLPVRGTPTKICVKSKLKNPHFMHFMVFQSGGWKQWQQYGVGQDQHSTLAYVYQTCLYTMPRAGPTRHPRVQHFALSHTPYHTIPYHAISYHTIPYHAIPYHTIPYHTIPHRYRETLEMRSNLMEFARLSVFAGPCRTSQQIKYLPPRSAS